MKKFNVGVVGVGHIANAFHIPSFIKNKSVKKIYIFDVEKENLKKTSKKFKFLKTFTNFKKMILDNNINILSICTPPAFHFKYILEGIKYNLNMIVEKPFVTSSKQLNYIRKKLRTKKINCYCAYHQRYRPISAKIKKIIQNKKIGKIYYVNIIYRRFRGIPKHSKFFSLKKYSGGGPLIDIGTHYFDLIGWFLNFPKIKNYQNYSLKKIFSSKKKIQTSPFKKFENEEMATGHFELNNGCVIKYELSYALNVKDEISNIEIFGTEGMIKWPEGKMVLIKNNKRLNKKIRFSRKKASQIQTDNFIKSLSGKFQKSDLNEINFTVSLIEKLYKSTR